MSKRKWDTIVTAIVIFTVLFLFSVPFVHGQEPYRSPAIAKAHPPSPGYTTPYVQPHVLRPRVTWELVPVPTLVPVPNSKPVFRTPLRNVLWHLFAPSYRYVPAHSGK